MFWRRSISGRMVLAISLTLAATCTCLGLFSVAAQRNIARLALDDQLKLQYESVTAALDDQGQAGLAIGTAIAALPEVGKAVNAQDRAGLAAVLGPIYAALAQHGAPFLNIVVPPATAFLRMSDIGTFGDDMSARRQTIVVANREGRQVAGVENGRSTLNLFAITPVLRAGRSIAAIDVGLTIDQDFVDRAKRRFGVDLAFHPFHDGGFSTFGSTFGDTVLATPDELKHAFAGQPVRRNVTLAGHPGALYLGQIKDYTGQPVAVLELIKNTTDYETAASRAQRILLSGVAAILLAGIVVAALLGRGLARPLTAITAAMRALSSGDVTVAIPGQQRRDEVGTMADAVVVFKGSMIETERLREAQAQAKQQADADRRAAVLDLAARFETGVGGIAAAVAAAAADLQVTARSMAQASDQTTGQAASVATASEEASASAQAVAIATEQLAASINEMSQQMVRSNGMIAQAVQEANRSDEQIGGLTEAADHIGKVVNLISDIAGQTNLLALNATIEAARAGEAGRGFAVVASEVKALAIQTARATEQIGQQIAAIQAASMDSARSIRAIAATIGRVSEAASSIAAGIEEQGAATQEIARNVAQAANGTAEVTISITAVSQAASTAGRAASSTLAAAEALQESGQSLRTQVDGFLREVRAA